MSTTYSSNKSSAFRASTVVGNAFILEYMTGAPENYMRVYLFALMQYQNPYFANDDIAMALSLSDIEVAQAFLYWQDMGLLRILRYEPLHIEFSDAAISEHYAPAREGRYNELIARLRNELGTRVLTATELSTVYDWIEVFGLSEDVVVMLVAYCLNFKGKRVSVKYMSEVAKTWADIGIATKEDANKHIMEHEYDIGAVRDIKKRWRISRNPTQDELDLYHKWTGEWNIPHDVVMAACAELVYATNPTFGYLDSVLASYREKGVTTLDSLNQIKRKNIAYEEFTRELLKVAGLVNKPTRAQIERVSYWVDIWNIPKEALTLLAEYARKASKPFDYMSKTVSSWNDRQIRTVEAAKSDLESPESSKPRGGNKRATSFPQRKYTTQDLKKLGIDVGDET